MSAVVYEGDDQGNVMVVSGTRREPLPPRFDLRNHSPTGFQWGYGGSGPSQLALALLAHCLGDTREALAWYQPFKWRVIASLPRDTAFRLTPQQIRDVLRVLKDEARRGGR